MNPAKWAKALVLVMSIECLGTSIAFAWTHNWKMALYWLLVAGINGVASTF